MDGFRLIRPDLRKSPALQRLLGFFRPSSGSPQIDRLIYYYFAVLIVLIALIGLHLVIHNQAMAQVQIGEIITNLSGNQRMLSQRIALFAEILVTDTTASGRQTARTELL